MELLNKGFKFNELELYVLNFIFSNCKIKNVIRNKYDSFNIFSFDGINVDVKINSFDNNCRMMEVSFYNLQNDKEAIIL